MNFHRMTPRFAVLLLTVLTLFGCTTTRASMPRAPLSHISGEEMLISAYSLMGTPYTPGGSTPSEGFDCSGFVRYVLLENGLSLPERSSDEMYRAGWQPVAREALKPGDLVFFQIGRQSRVNHVGIYVGDGQFIHAPARGGAVRVENLSLPYWQSAWSGARRVAAGG